MKKVCFSYGNLLLFRINCDYRALKIGLFHRVKELFKLNQTWHGVYREYPESKMKRIFAIAWLGKKLAIHT